MKNVLYKALFGLAIFAAVSVGAQAAPTDPTLDTTVASFNYNEECNNEGCFSEEVRELYSSYHQAAILSMADKVKANLPGDRNGINVGRDNERKWSQCLPLSILNN